MLSAHYRKQLNFTFEGLTQAGTALERIDNLIIRLSDIKTDKGDAKVVDDAISELMSGFTTAMDDDLNTSGAFGIFFDFIHRINSLIS
jgi:cysteinyl-tRNA synthetase